MNREETRVINAMKTIGKYCAHKSCEDCIFCIDKSHCECLLIDLGCPKYWEEDFNKIIENKNAGGK